MEARYEKTLESLNESTRFVIHTYERAYDWTERKCCQSWNDVMRMGGNNLISVHFVGPTAYAERSQMALLLALNQQQCLITVMQFPAAVAIVAKGTVLANRYSSSKMFNWILLNPFENVGCRFNPSSDEAWSTTCYRSWTRTRNQEIHPYNLSGTLDSLESGSLREVEL